MARPTQAPDSIHLDARLYCDYSKLVRLQGQAEAFSLLPNLKAGSALSGRHSSIFRGRGLNFEELRHYQLGDDIRNLDWKVTMRTGKPHVRSYTEEKDRNVMLCIDQRSGMFFSSVDTMKSVVAADIAALCAWRILKDGDRVGFSVADTRAIINNKPQRSQNSLLSQLKRLASSNQSLNVHSIDADSVSFKGWIQHLGRMKLTQSTLVLISDWQDCTAEDLNQLKQLQQHNDVLAIVIHDVAEHALPTDIASENWVLGDGTYQLNIDSRSKVKAVNAYLGKHVSEQRQGISKLMAIKQLPHIELDTSGHHIEQFTRAIGART